MKIIVVLVADLNKWQVPEPFPQDSCEQGGRTSVGSALSGTSKDGDPHPATRVITICTQPVQGTDLRGIYGRQKEARIKQFSGVYEVAN